MRRYLCSYIFDLKPQIHLIPTTRCPQHQPNRDPAIYYVLSADAFSSSRKRNFAPLKLEATLSCCGHRVKLAVEKHRFMLNARHSYIRYVTACMLRHSLYATSRLCTLRHSYVCYVTACTLPLPDCSKGTVSLPFRQTNYRRR